VYCACCFCSHATIKNTTFVKFQILLSRGFNKQSNCLNKNHHLHMKIINVHDMLLRIAFFFSSFHGNLATLVFPILKAVACFSNQYYFFQILHTFLFLPNLTKQHSIFLYVYFSFCVPLSSLSKSSNVMFASTFHMQSSSSRKSFLLFLSKLTMQ